MKKNVIFLIFFCFFISSLFCQFSSINNYVTRVWTSTDGLPGNSVSDIVQSKDGFIYFGTYECLVKFDGMNFYPMNKYTDDKLSFISARSVFEDSRGMIWVGSNDEGVQKIGKKFYEHLTMENGLPNNSIRAFAEDRYGNVWIGTAAGVVYVNPEGEILVPDVTDGIDISHVLVNQLFCDTAGRIWMITTEEKGLYVYTNNSFQKYKGLDSFGNYIASSISQDKNGNYWIGLSYDGIVRLNNGEVTKIKTNTVCDLEPTICIYADSTGALWFGTEKGLVLYSDGVFSTYDDNQAIVNGSINKILSDREGNIWIATDNGGVGKISLGKFRMNSMSAPVNAICEDIDGDVWIGTDDGLKCYRNEVEINNPLSDFCSSVRVRHIASAANGDLLVNCYSKPAMVRYSKKTGKIEHWSTDDGLAGNKTRVSIETKYGDVFCGTTTGLSMITDGTVKNFNISDGFDNEYIMCLYEDDEGVLWVGTDGGGIYLLTRDGIMKKISTEDGLCGNVVFKIFQDKQKVYWICTGTGISRLEKGDLSILSSDLVLDFFNYNSSVGLGSDSIFQMIVDQNNYAWFISNRGISSVDFNSMTELKNGNLLKLDTKFYNQNDGLKSSGANSTALSMIDRYGRIWFTMADGVAIYDPVRTSRNSVPPIIQIVEVKIDDKTIDEFNEPIIIPPNAKYLSIMYTGLSYTASERNRFTYKLSGFEENYSELTASKSVTFTNLKPGKYIFYVNMENSEGFYAENPASVVLIQEAFFYQQVWFWILVAGIILVIIAVVFILVNIRHKKNELLLMTKIQMATVDLQMEKDKSDRLLRNILPPSIAERLKSKGMGNYGIIADRYDNVTVLFSDIVSFTNATSNHSAQDIVDSLNNLIRRFDVSARKLGVEKIKTIGDAYMAACGVPSKNERHAETMLKFAIQMYKDLADYNKSAKIKFRIRIGLNSGPVIAGVIGMDKFIYDIWGDTVNVASRMESNCNPGHIRMTETVKENLEKNGHFYSYREDVIDVKGKGLMHTYELPDK